MTRFSDKLKNHLNGVRAFSVGLSADDVRQLKLTPDLMQDILDSLVLGNTIDQQIALFFAEVLIWPGKVDFMHESLFISRIIELSSVPNSHVQASAVTLLVRFHARVPNFRLLMMAGLKSGNSMVRKEALLAHALYLQPMELEPLECFENDDYVVELTMGGALVYELRNLALDVIECIIGKKLKKNEKLETKPTGEVVFWWDWAPYHAWKKGGFFRTLFIR